MFIGFLRADDRRSAPRVSWIFYRRSPLAWPTRRLCYGRTTTCDRAESATMLEVDGLSVSYGGLAALRGVSLTVAEGQFVAIVGPNGAGKTTLFKAISGTVRAGLRARSRSRDTTCSRCRRASAPISASPTCRKAGRSSPR